MSRLRPEEFRFIDHVKQVYKDPVTLVDVGANAGSYSREFQTMVHCNRVHLFEPIPELYARLPSDDTCKKYNMALGAENTTAVFNQAAAPSRKKSSFLDRPFYREKNIKITKIDVDVRRLQDVIPGEHVHVLKIDTEGHELEVLRGCEAMLDNKAIDHIQFEYGGCFRDAGLKLNDVVEFLHQFDYGVYDLLETGFKRIENYQDRNYRWCNFYAKKL